MNLIASKAIFMLIHVFHRQHSRSTQTYRKGIDQIKLKIDMYSSRLRWKVKIIGMWENFKGLFARRKVIDKHFGLVGKKY